MRKITAFNFISLNGFFKGPGEDIGWTSRHHTETGESVHTVESLGKGNALLFGRVTYELMESFWQSSMAYDHHPATAKLMNEAEKFVFSKTLDAVTWQNTTLLKANMPEEVRRLKQQPGKDITILGSGSIITQLAAEGLIDEYEVVVYPIALGKGSPLFEGLPDQLTLTLVSVKTLNSGTVLLTYRK